MAARLVRIWARPPEVVEVDAEPRLQVFPLPPVEAPEPHQRREAPRQSVLPVQVAVAVVVVVADRAALRAAAVHQRRPLLLPPQQAVVEADVAALRIRSSSSAPLSTPALRWRGHTVFTRW